ncbi:MAG: YlxR family protein [Syntrophomonadaceae bacterium]|nr:YlxR family protein [Syntrophomonadaceae bacterium]MDD3888647.1 YlxR family protein [Syntrophomonadaceae bacterium]MDD4548270.1 YlxR family protein [Syntrophomonadaceae bacterium]
MAKTRKIPQRMCVGCREMTRKKELIRVLRTPEGDIEIDTTGKKAGRGAYLCPQLECFTKAVKGKSLQKALNQEVPREVIDILRKQIEAIAHSQ